MTQNKLQEKLIKIKDQFIVDIFNLTQRAMKDIQDIQAESKEINKEVEIPIKKKGK